MHVLVMTIVHHPLDARIHHRQIRALVEAGHAVSYAAPWSSTGVEASAAIDGIELLDLPRAVGRHRFRALRAARRLLARSGRDYDLVLLHDPELLLAVWGQLRRLPAVVFDVHEDSAASLIDRPWVPRLLRPGASWALRRLESWAERRVDLLLAEASYQERFRRSHPFVPNVPPRPTGMPPQPGGTRVVYLGRIARSRGALELLELADRLVGPYELELIGQADPDVEPLIREAARSGKLTWHGFLPNELALQRIEGAMAGLSLVHPQPNHAGSLQTKVLEYLSRRVPVISTELAVTGPFIREHQVGFTVPPGDVEAVAVALERLHGDERERRAIADRGFALVRDELNWDVAGHRFVNTLEAAAAGRPLDT